MSHDTGIEPAARRALLTLARDAIAAGLARERGRDGLASPRAGAAAPHALLDQRRGAFVTLSLRTRLRGCIGRVEPDQPLRSMIPEVARSAAFADPRFSPVGTGELALLVIEISLLSPLVVIDPGDVVVGQHGLSIASRGRRGLLLPQVPLEYGWSREEFLDQLCAKAGLPAGAWREPGARIRSFTAEVFSERDE